MRPAGSGKLSVNMDQSLSSVPAIRKLTIERFRGIENFECRPAEGVNVIVGGGDVGKTTVLDAIAMLLSPTNTTVLSDADYFDRSVEAGFRIEAVNVSSRLVWDQSTSAVRTWY
jgi:putative ATP-dependent endonuclease of OLD family